MEQNSNSKRKYLCHEIGMLKIVKNTGWAIYDSQISIMYNDDVYVFQVQVTQTPKL